MNNPKTELVFNAIGHIDYAFVESADASMKPITRRRRGLRAGIVAACLILCVLSAVIPLMLGGDPFFCGALTGGVFFRPSANTGDTFEETGCVVYRAHNDIVEEEFAGYRHTRVIPIEYTDGYVGDRLGEVTVKHYWKWENTDDRDEHDICYLRAEVYSVVGLDRSEAVCIRFLDENPDLTTYHYYTYFSKDVSLRQITDFFAQFQK